MDEPLSIVGQIALVGFSVSVVLVLLANSDRYRRWFIAFGLTSLVGSFLYDAMGIFRLGVMVLVGYWYWHLFRTSGEEDATRPGDAATKSDPAIEAAVEQDALSGDVARIRR
jgi:hypothetical protein